MIFMLCSGFSGFHNLQISYCCNLSLPHVKGLAFGEHESSSAHRDDHLISGGASGDLTESPK